MFKLIAPFLILVILNFLFAVMTKSFSKEVIGWWRPWAGVLVLLPPVGILTVISISISLGVVLVGICGSALIQEFRDFFTSHPPKEEEKNSGDVHGREQK